MPNSARVPPIAPIKKTIRLPIVIWKAGAIARTTRARIVTPIQYANSKKSIYIPIVYYAPFRPKKSGIS
jgi:hypothetical protein